MAVLTLLALQCIVQPVLVFGSNNDAVSANVTAIDASTEDPQVSMRIDAMEGREKRAPLFSSSSPHMGSLTAALVDCAAVAF